MVNTEVTGGGTKPGWSARAGIWRVLREATAFPPATNSKLKLNWAQSVTGTVVKEDVNSHWTVKGPDDKNFCMRGEPVECGQKIRLEHLSTHRNLHSHHFSSPLSSQQEVSAFGESGRGDTGDVWRVMCEGDYWTRGDNVMLKHSDTGVFLSASGHTFGRPINGQVS